MFESLRIGAAFRRSRQYVGGMTGFLFTLSNIFSVPLKATKFAPVLTMGLLGLFTFLFEIKRNYTSTTSQSLTIEDYKIKSLNSYAITLALIKRRTDSITGQLISQVDNSELKSVIIEQPPAQDKELIVHKQKLEERFHGVIKNRYDWVACLYKYTDCLSTGLAQVGSHFMECLLLKGQENPDLFDMNSLSADNIIVCFLGLVALYNGYQSAKESYLAIEQQAIDLALLELTEPDLRSAFQLFKHYEMGPDADVNRIVHI